MAARKGDVKDLSLAAAGQKRIDWADQHMPVLRQVRQEFARTKPLKGLRVSACLHVTTETANLMRTLKAGGASVMLCASNPLSTQDDTAAALVAREGIPTYAVRGEDNKTYYQHLHAVLGQGPTVTLDDGADLVSLLHTDASYEEQLGRLIASMEETTTGVIRLRAMENNGVLRLPVIAVNDATTKHLFDNRYGTGQSTPGRRAAGDQYPAGRQGRGGRRLRLVRQRRGQPGARPGRSGDRDRGGPDPCPGGCHGRLSGHADAGRLPGWETSSSPSPAIPACCAANTSGCSKTAPFCATRAILTWRSTSRR